MSEGIPEFGNIIDQHRARIRGSLLANQNRPEQTGSLDFARSDHEHLAETPVAVVFGTGDAAREFEIYPRSHMEADEWRNAALAFVNELAPILKKDSTGLEGATGFDAESLLQYANIFIVAHIPAVCELVFLWESSLPRKHILEELRATDAQLASAFLKILGLAFPFGAALKAVNKMIQGETEETAKEAPKKSTEN